MSIESRIRSACLPAVWLLCACLSSGCTGVGSASGEGGARGDIKTIAMQVANLEAMAAFYREAFGVEFRAVDTHGILSLFGELDGITLKLVPIREAPDFENYPSHQLGLEVADVETVIGIARKYGGRQEGQLEFRERRVHAAIRDPDGNTLELDSPIRGG